MKSRYIFPAVLAAVAMFASCSEKENLYLDNLQVSSSYIAISAEGGDFSIDVTATEAWTMDFDVDVIGSKLDKEKGIVNDTTQVKQLDTDGNSWFTASVRSGEKGKTTVKFSAEATTASRSSNIVIKAGDKVQNLVVSQKVATTDVAVTPLAEVLSGAEGKTYRVKGTCSVISNTTYGNWYMTDDEGNSLYIYGTVDASGSYNWSKFNIALGDEVTVEGIKVVYSGTIELKDATFISVKKALIACDDVEKYISMDADTFTLKLSQKGTGISFESEADWLSFEGNGYTSDGNGNLTFTIKAEENETGVARTGTLVFKSTKGSESTELPVTVTQLPTKPIDSNLLEISKTLLNGTSSAPRSFDVNLKNAKVTYINGSNYFIEDEKGGLLVYSSALSLKVGQVINGRVWGKGYAYNNLPEATSFNLQFATVTTSDSEVVPTEVTLADLAADYDSYLSRYVKIKGVTVSTAIDVDYEAVNSKGAVTDGTNTFNLNHQSTGKFNGNKIYYYVQAAEGSTVDVVCIPTMYKTNKQLNIYAQKWISASK